jgi:hypothetical protein
VDKSKEPRKNSETSNHSGDMDRITTYGRLPSKGVNREAASIEPAILQYHSRVITHKVTVRSTTRMLLNKMNCINSGSGSISQPSNGSAAVMTRPTITGYVEKDSHLRECATKHATNRFKQNKPLARSNILRVGNTQYSL